MKCPLRILKRVYESSPKELLEHLLRRCGVRGPRMKPVTKEFLRSDEYRALMLKDTPCDGQYGLHEAATYTRSYRFRHHDALARLGVFRWRGVQENLELILDLVSDERKVAVDFGGAGAPLGFHSIVVDTLAQDALGRPVRYRSIKELGRPVDVVFACHVLEHVADLDEVLREIRAALVEGGALIVLVPSFTNPGWRAGVHRDRGFGVHLWTFGLAGTPNLPPGLVNYAHIDQKLGSYFKVERAAYCGDDGIFLHCRKQAAVGERRPPQDLARASILRAPLRFEVLAENLRDDPNGRYKVVRNLDTGLVQLHPLPSPEEEAEFYARDQQVKRLFGAAETAKLDAHFRPDKERQLRFIMAEQPPPARFLDVGCGYGQTMKLAAEAGYEASGTDVPGERLERARERMGLSVFGGDLTRSNPLPAGETFDVILMSHVLEHLLHPEQVLVRVAELLRPDGLLVVEVPNGQDQMLERCEAYRRFFWQRAHLAYFTPATLEEVLRRAGYAAVRIAGRQRYSVASVLRWLETGKPGLDDPLYVAPTPLSWLDEVFRRDAEGSLRSDALVALARLHGNARAGGSA